MEFYNVYPLLEDNQFEMEYADQKCRQLKQVFQRKTEDNSESTPTAYPVSTKHAWNELRTIPNVNSMPSTRFFLG